MIKIKDIFQSVCTLIADETDITIEDSDLDEPVVRPSFRITMDTVKTGFYSSALRSVKVYFNIYFYASDREHPKSEIFDIENVLSFLFLEPLGIKDGCCVLIDNVDFEKVDNVILNCGFDFEIATEFIDESDLEIMEELITNVTMSDIEIGNFNANVEEDEDD